MVLLYLYHFHLPICTEISNINTPGFQNGDGIHMVKSVDTLKNGQKLVLLLVGKLQFVALMNDAEKNPSKFQGIKIPVLEFRQELLDAYHASENDVRAHLDEKDWVHPTKNRKSILNRTLQSLEKKGYVTKEKRGGQNYFKITLKGITVTHHFLEECYELGEWIELVNGVSGMGHRAHLAFKVRQEDIDLNSPVKKSP